MNKKIINSALILPVAAALAVSCAEDGFSPENWEPSVQDSQLGNPTGITISKTSTTDSTKTVVINWDVVHGAGGYLVTVTNISDPAHPTDVVTDSLIDRCSIALELPNEETYNFGIRSAANAKFGNKQAEEVSLTKFDTYVPSVEIPAGSEIASWLAENLVDSDVEQGIALVAGAQYTLDTLADFRLNIVEFRGDRVNRPTIIVGEKGGFVTYGGLKLKYLNLDCTNATGQNGIITMGSDTELAAPLYKKYAENSNNTYYHAEKTIMVQGCVFKAVPNAFLHDGKTAWCVKDFNIKDCFIELNPDDSKLGSSGYPFIDFDNGGITIKDITLANMTLINLKKSSAYFIRFSNGSNSAIQKAYGSAYTGTFSMDHCTLVRCTTGGQFGNNCWTSGSATTISWKSCIFYDTNLLQKLVRNLPFNFTNADNTIWAVTNTVDNTDKEKFATEEDPQFAGGEISADVIDGYDFTKPNGGFDLKPTNGIAAEKQYGDPRWFE